MSCEVPLFTLYATVPFEDLQRKQNGNFYLRAILYVHACVVNYVQYYNLYNCCVPYILILFNSSYIIIVYYTSHTCIIHTHTVSTLVHVMVGGLLNLKLTYFRDFLAPPPEEVGHEAKK